MEIIIQYKGKSTRELKRLAKKVVTKTSMEFLNLGKEAHKHMLDIIDSNRKRVKKQHPQNSMDSKESLIDAIKLNTEVSKNQIKWEIGDINYLNSNAPHWASINWGSSHLVGKTLLGRFDDGQPSPSSGKTSLWHPISEGNDENWFMTVKTPIMPLNYLEKTVNFIKRKIKDIV